MISMITTCDELYQRIWNDYYDSKEIKDSFIYTYFKNNKDNQAKQIAESSDSLKQLYANEKKDHYLCLCSTFLAYKNGILSKEEYLDCFRTISNTINNPKLPEKYEPFASDDIIEQAEEDLETKLLIRLINNFFYKLGFRKKKKTGKDTTVPDVDEIEDIRVEASYIKKKYGNIDNLDLWTNYYIYCLDNDPSKGGPQLTEYHSSGLTDDYIQKCESLFSVLNKENRSNVFMPLYFDLHSGIAVTILGNDWFPDYSSNNSCRTGVMYFSSEIQNEDIDELSIGMNIDFYDNVKEAFKGFKTTVIKTDHHTFDNYKWCNGDIPDNVDSIFHNYFYAKEEAKEKGYPQRYVYISNNENNKELDQFKEKKAKEKMLKSFKGKKT